MSEAAPLPAAIGKYRLDAILGKGAMGVVYKAFDPLIERTVALKTVRTDALGEAQGGDGMDAALRFRKEAQAAGRLAHPSIVAIYDYGEDEDVAFIAMEYVEGAALSSLLAGERPAALGQAMQWMADLLDALAYSHERGVVHRDIKPANLLLTAGLRIKVSDFGIARLESSTLTQTGAMIGTPSYMSPEQFRGDPVDGRSDLFSAGIILYQLLTGQRPFAGSAATVMQKILNHTPPRPSQLNETLPAEFDDVVMRALAKHPADRYASARAFLQALLAAQHRYAARTGPGAGAAPGSGGGASGPADDSDATILASPAAAAQLFGTPALATGALATGALATAALPPWLGAVLPALELALAQQIGPMARLLLRKTGATAADYASLVDKLAQHIVSPKGRARFEQDAAALRQPPPAEPPPPADAGAAAADDNDGNQGHEGCADATAVAAAVATARTPAAAPTPPPADAAFLAAVAAGLTQLIGPIAAIVVKRAARQSSERAAVLQLAAAHIEAEAERQRFLQAHG